MKEARIVACMGASESGKSAHVKQLIAAERPERLAVWDRMDEYGAFAKSAPSLAALVAAVRSPRFAVRFVPSGDRKLRARQFDVFCTAAYMVGNLFMVAEELNSVTTASHAPGPWQDCTSRGRHRGLQVFGLSQRPAGVDKDFFGNATCVRTGRLNQGSDIDVMADVLMVPRQEVAALLPLQWIERDMKTGIVTRGTLTFSTKARRKRGR